MNVLVFALHVVDGLLCVEALDSFLYFVAEDFQLSLEFVFRINRHQVPFSVPLDPSFVTA